MTTENNAAPDETDRVLAEWADTLVEELAIQHLTVDVRAVLSLAGVAAHSVVRPAAPLTTFLVGYAAGIAAATGSVAPDAAAAAATATARNAIRSRTADPAS